MSILIINPNYAASKCVELLNCFNSIASRWIICTFIELDILNETNYKKIMPGQMSSIADLSNESSF